MSLDEAFDCLEKDCVYLTEDGVFPEELIRNFIKSKCLGCRQLSAFPDQHSLTDIIVFKN
ncbi:MAG: hypothetical protein IJP16_05525 [Clostridia bacterium]|nr:hypothetical protein [Clostridia bacterium]